MIFKVLQLSKHLKNSQEQVKQLEERLGKVEQEIDGLDLKSNATIVRKRSSKQNKVS